MRSRPRKALTSEDLPTFGRPMTARRTTSASSSTASSTSGASETRRSSRSPVPSPWRPRPAAARRAPGRGTRGERDVAAASRSCCRHHHRQVTAAQDVGDLLIARAQAAARVDDEEGDLGVGERRAGLVLDETDSGSLSSRSTPPVSISVKRRPVPLRGELLAVARDAGPLVHDRLARLRERLTSEDLPTFG
jgi:hypothetical protein